MNKYLPACFFMCVAPSAFANIGSGWYLSVGAGAGMLNGQELESFNLDYPQIYFKDSGNTVLLEEAVNAAFNETAQYNDANATVVAGRAAVGYLWDIFEGEPTKIGNSIYTFNSTLGLEFGYRLFDNVTDSLTEVEDDTVNFPIPSTCQDASQPGPPVSVPCQVFEEANSKTRLQAFDVLAVLRLPFTEDNKLALLLKGGVAYNMYEVENSINIETDAPDSAIPPNYEATYDLDAVKHDEFLPSLGVGLEYMLYSHFGVAVEYNAIMGSSHNADSQLITGNFIIRI